MMPFLVGRESGVDDWEWVMLRLIFLQTREKFFRAVGSRQYRLAFTRLLSLFAWRNHHTLLLEN